MIDLSYVHIRLLEFLSLICCYYYDFPSRQRNLQWNLCPLFFIMTVNFVLFLPSFGGRSGCGWGEGSNLEAMGTRMLKKDYWEIAWNQTALPSYIYEKRRRTWMYGWMYGWMNNTHHVYSSPSLPYPTLLDRYISPHYRYRSLHVKSPFFFPPLLFLPLQDGGKSRFLHADGIC